MPLHQTRKRTGVTLHFLPEGTEYRFSDRKPTIGDVSRRDGEEWLVVDVREDKDGNTVVTLRPADSAT